MATLADACSRGWDAGDAVADARPAQWRKVIFNSSTNPVGALTGLSHGRVCERPDLRALVSGLVDEGKAVASAQGITLDADPEDLIDHAAKPEVAYGHKASMLQDVEARRQTEIDYLNGGIARFGRELGVATPLHDTITALIKGVGSFMDLGAELERRFANMRAAMGEHGLDALVVSGNEYSGLRGRRDVHVRLPDRPSVRVRRACRPTGSRSSCSRPRHGTSGSTAPRRSSRSSTPRPGAYIADHARGAGWKRIGVYGLDYIMAVRDYQALDGLDLVAFDVEFDLARAVKSEAELASVRDSVRINQRGFEIWHEAYAPGKTAAEVMAVAEEWFITEGCGRLTMNMVLTGTDTYARPEFKIARSTRCSAGSCCRRSRSPGRDALGRGVARRPRGGDRAVG